MENTSVEKINTSDSDQSVVVDSSLIPSQHDDSSSVMSATRNASTTHRATITTTTISESTVMSVSAVGEEARTIAYDDKVELGSTRSLKELSYGPTFKEETLTQEEIHLTETLNESKISEPDSKKDFLSSNFYRRGSTTTTLVDEEQGKIEKDTGVVRGEVHIPKTRSVLYRQLFGDARYVVSTWIFAIAMISYFIYEMAKSRQLSGSSIQTSPFNPMIGPNYVALITMKSKFAPCMKNVPKYPPSYIIGNCYSVNSTCTIETACGGFNGDVPNQASRFVEAIFVHAGFIHLLVNLIVHFHLGTHVERVLGSLRFIVVYIGSGIWGFILSATLSGSLSSSMGCSGALFGLVGYKLVEIGIAWKDVRSPLMRLLKQLIVILISLGIGLLPGFDNFAHIGGLIMGVLLSVLLSSSLPFSTKTAGVCMWVSRAIALLLTVALYVGFLLLFLKTEDLDSICPNCKYFSCIPVSDWCNT